MGSINKCRLDEGELKIEGKVVRVSVIEGDKEGKYSKMGKNIKITNHLKFARNMTLS